MKIRQMPDIQSPPWRGGSEQSSETGWAPWRGVRQRSEMHPDVRTGWGTGRWRRMRQSSETGWVPKTFRKENLSKATTVAVLFLIGLCFLSTPFVSFGQDTSSVVVATDSLNDTIEEVVTYDSSSLAIRSMEEGVVQEYLSDSEFDYARQDQPPSSLFGKILRWIGELFGKLFGGAMESSVFQYLIVGVALALVIYLLIRSEFSGFFKRKGSSSNTIEFDEIEENIEQMNFDVLIAEALAAGNLRRAVRLRYLYLLRTMSERNLIEWRIEKTNSDYLYELREPELRSGFTDLTRVFDYVWYGGFQIERRDYDRISRNFDAFTQTVQGAKA